MARKIYLPELAIFGAIPRTVTRSFGIMASIIGDKVT